MAPWTGPKSWFTFLSISLFLGIFLRLSFPGDIEYKDDESYMFKASQTVGVTKPWPMLGMLSGAGIKNPGMSVWVFVVLARVFHATTPPELARAVQILNVLGLFTAAFFAYRMVPEGERRAWYWAVAFAAVNPVAVIFQRKIWAQSTLPLFCILLWMAWRFRNTWSGAFLWGLLGACLGQIHLSGIYSAAGLFLWTLVHDRKAKWASWLLGSLAGAISFIPWFHYMLSRSPTAAPFDWQILWWMIFPKYWIYWIWDCLGFGLYHSLGHGPFLDFMSYPRVGGVPTYLVGILHISLIVLGILLLMSAYKNKEFQTGIWNLSETGLAVNSLFIASGVLMTLSGFRIFQHYLIMSFPLEWVWLARFGLSEPRKGSKLLGALWTVQLLISVAFLAYIHVHHGVPTEDYGTAYQYQS